MVISIFKSMKLIKTIFFLLKLNCGRQWGKNKQKKQTENYTHTHTVPEVSKTDLVIFDRLSDLLEELTALIKIRK